MDAAARRPTRFDPALADVAVVRFEGRHWTLTLHRFTGDLLTTTPLHVEGEFRTIVLRMVDRVLAGWGLESSDPASWMLHQGAWSASVRVRDTERQSTVRL